MKTRHFYSLAFIVLCLCCTMQNEAIAQIGNAGLIYQGAYNNAMFLNTKIVVERSMRERAERKENETTISGNIPSSTRSVGLDFVPSSKIHEAVVRSIAQVMAQGDNGKIKTNIDLLNRGNLLGEFDRLLRRYGFNSHNLADAYAAYMLLSWQAATGSNAEKSSKGIEVFREKMRTSLGNNEEMRKFTNAQKQQMAETISYIAVLFTLANQDVIKKGDTNAISRSHENIRQTTMKITGVDITKYTLSDAGFNPNEN